MWHIAEYQREKLKYWFQLLLNHIYFIVASCAIWRHRSGSTLAQVMYWCHYLNQCWLLISEVLWHSSERNSTARAQAIILHNELESYILKITVISLRESGAIVLSLFTPRTKHHVCTQEKFSIMEYVRVHDNIFLSMACNALTSIKRNRRIGSAANWI